ncbi:hypothetical protein ABZ504_27645, partial [Streptomyces mirabilis]
PLRDGEGLVGAAGRQPPQRSGDFPVLPALVDTASDRRHDALGRLRPADPEAYARAWLASSTYASAATASLLTAAWAPERNHDPA